jgi:hypothetical protein
MIDNHYCAIRGCGRPGEAQSRHELSGLVMSAWLCDHHTREGGIPNALELDVSRITWLIKATQITTAVG